MIVWYDDSNAIIVVKIVGTPAPYRSHCVQKTSVMDACRGKREPGTYQVEVHILDFLLRAKSCETVHVSRRRLRQGGYVGFRIFFAMARRHSLPRANAQLLPWDLNFAMF